MRVSVAMATYNGATHIREQLDSIAKQTLLPAELVVSDDGSTDDTLAVIRDFAEHAPFLVRILSKKERLGYADNFLNAASECAHDLIAFSDHDDVWLPTKIETGHRRITQDSSLLSMHRLLLTDEALAPKTVWDQGIGGDAVFEALALDPYITGWGNTMMFRRELVSLVSRSQRPLEPEKSSGRLMSHDTWIYSLAAALGRVSHIAEPLILYRQHGNNVFGVKPLSPVQKLAVKARVPVARLKGQAEFDGAMARLLDEVARRKNEPFAERASVASARFARRRDYLMERAAIYCGHSVHMRWRAYRNLGEFQREDRFVRRSRAKDLLLGVTGLNRHLTA